MKSGLVAVLNALIVLLLMALPFAGQTTPSPAKQLLPIELRPYRVLCLISFGNDAAFSPEFRRSLIAEFEQAAARSVGEMWQVEVTEDQSLAPAGPAALRRLTSSDLKRRFAPAEFDKVHLLTIEGEAAGYRLEGREWDATVEQLGAGAARIVFERREAVHAFLSLIQEIFRPVAAIDVLPGGAVSLRALGGEFTPPDAVWSPHRPGRLWEPFYRYLSAEHTVQRIQAVPWTYLTPDKSDRGTALCTVVTGLRAPLSGHRRRVEALALGIGSRGEQTQLTLLSYAPAARPLVGIEVNVIGDLQAKEKPLALVSDRQGTVRVPVNAAHSVVWLDIRSGQAHLARLPFVPGVRSAESLELPDDTLRLNVEGDISILQADLVDTVARRAVLAARARAAARTADWPRVEAVLKELAELPKPGSFASELNGIRLPALQAARSRKDKAAEARIQKLCEETQALIVRYLDADKLKVLTEEIDELRKVDADNKAALAAPEPVPKKSALPAAEPRSPTAP